MEYGQTGEGLHWFDWLVAVLILVGAGGGWRKGARLELPRLVMWLLILAVARPAALLGGDFADFLGLSRMGGRLCAFGWVAAFLMWFFSVLTWGNEPVRLEDWEEEEYEPPGAPGAGARIGGAVMGMVKAACVVVTLIAVLAIIPGGLTRFADLRRSVLEESVTGVVTQIYWYKLTPESDEAAGRSS